jgi:hypothetical protein
MKIVIAGGSGFIGRALTDSLVRDGHQVAVLSRRAVPSTRARAGVRHLTWDPGVADAPWVRELAGAAGIVNLAGTNIGTRPWTAGHRRRIVQSRLDATTALVDGIATLALEDRPTVLVSASGIDYYGDRESDDLLTEEAPPGDTFLAGMAASWEAAAVRAEALGVRVVRIRTALVLSRESAALRIMVLPFRLFVGGRLGSGRQWFPWIHLADAVGLYRFALEHPTLNGPINGNAPDVPRQAEFAEGIGRTLHRPCWLPAPAFLMRLVLRGQADLFLHGRRPSAQRALDAGYQYRYPSLGEALAASLGKAPEILTLPSAR